MTLLRRFISAIMLCLRNRTATDNSFNHPLPIPRKILMSSLFSLRNRTVCLAFGIAAPLVVLLANPSYSFADTSSDTYKNLETFSDVLNILQNDYVEEVDTQKLIEGAIKGMLSSLDPHSSFLKPAR